MGLWCLALTGCGDNTRPLSPNECDAARQLSRDFKRRIHTLRNTLEADIVLLGRYPEERFVTRLVARTHQPPLREAVGLAEENYTSLLNRMSEASCSIWIH